MYGRIWLNLELENFHSFMEKGAAKWQLLSVIKQLNAKLMACGS
jgi:hypothetical protein